MSIVKFTCTSFHSLPPKTLPKCINLPCKIAITTVLMKRSFVMRLIFFIPRFKILRITYFSFYDDTYANELEFWLMLKLFFV